MDKKAARPLMLGDSFGSPELNEGRKSILKEVTVYLEPTCKPSKCRLWIVFFACCTLHFMVFGMHYSFGAMFPQLLKTFNAGQGQTGGFLFYLFPFSPTVLLPALYDIL